MHGEFAHAIQGFGDLLEITVLGLAERDGVADVAGDGVDPVDLRVEPRRNGQTCGIIFGGYDLETRRKTREGFV
jgi:hypothetical protein